MNISVDLCTGICEVPADTVSAAMRKGMVYLVVGAKVLEMNTTNAVETGLAMVTKAGEAMPNEFVRLKARGLSLDFPSISANQIGAALLRKADVADDFQRRMGK